MSYYQGDYYRGDFWSKLGKGVKRLGRNIGNVAKRLAPVAAIALPLVGSATLVGRAVATAQKIKRTGRSIRSAVNLAQQLPMQSPIAPTPVAVGAGQLSFLPPVMPTMQTARPVTQATRRIRRTRRAAYKRRKSTTRKRRTTRRRRRSR